MSKQISIISPSYSETAITGFLIGCEKEMRGHLLRVEFHRVQPNTRLFRDGKAVEWVKASAQHRKLAHYLADTYRDMLALNENQPA